MDINDLITKASLQIYESGIHVRDEMCARNRCFSFYVMSYVKYGEAELVINGISYKLRPSSVILIPPNVVHDHIKLGDEPTTFMWWHFDYKLFDSLDLLRLLGLPMVFTLKATKEFEDAFAQYAEILNQPVSLQNIILKKASAMMVMAHLLSAAQKDGKRQLVSVPECFREMLEIILSYNQPELSLQSLAERFNMHPTYVSNRFKHYYGIAPIALHRQFLIQYAKDMLGVQGMTVTEVADKLGFSSVSVFSRFFTGKIGSSPSQFALLEMSQDKNM